MRESLAPDNSIILFKKNAKLIGIVFLLITASIIYSILLKDFSQPILMSLLVIIFGYYGVIFVVKDTRSVLYVYEGQLGWKSCYGDRIDSFQRPVTDIAKLRQTFRRPYKRRPIIWLELMDSSVVKVPGDCWHAKNIEKLHEVLSVYNPRIELLIDDSFANKSD